MAKSPIEEARETYNIAHWSAGYFDLNDAGEVIAYPTRAREKNGINLAEIATEILATGLTFPVLVRFVDILTDRINTLCCSFEKAISDYEYKNKFTPVYPIKVNQQRQVVAEVLSTGKVGLEAGSKPELIAVLGLSKQPDALIICNGYKDREFIRLALIGRRLGHKVYIIIEKLSEVELILDEAKKIGVKPLLGVRARLASVGKGKWQKSAGEKAKFGLSSSHILSLIERLKEAKSLDCLQLLHFHLGSQIANIRDIQKAMREVSRYYAELHALQVPIQCVDVGGGLGIDYEGTRSRTSCSINYSVQEYANNIIHALAVICQEHDLPHPQVITESGRAVTAHHAVLITNVIDSEQVVCENDLSEPHADEPAIIQNLWQAYTEITDKSLLEIYHEAYYSLSEAHSMYTHGVINLEQRAKVEEIYHAICSKVRGLLQPGNRAHREVLDDLNERLADKVFCNFSVFQSTPDVWAIDQVFPIMPLSGLQERPSRRVILQDLTCDSDGCIENYVDGDGLDTTLALLPLHKDRQNLLGIFLVGAYQEILGDLHNLFGDTDSVNVQLCENGGYHLLQPTHGDTVEDVLRLVHIDPQELLSSYSEQLEGSDLPKADKKKYFDELSAGLKGYTYLED